MPKAINILKYSEEITMFDWKSFLEAVMLVCFGFSWPFNVIKAFEFLCMTLFLAASVVWLVSAVVCLFGLVVSEFTVGTVFYDNLKDKEIMYE